MILTVSSMSVYAADPTHEQVIESPRRLRSAAKSYPKRSDTPYPFGSSDFVDEQPVYELKQPAFARWTESASTNRETATAELKTPLKKDFMYEDLTTGQLVSATFIRTPSDMSENPATPNATPAEVSLHPMPNGRVLPILGLVLPTPK